MPKVKIITPEQKAAIDEAAEKQAEKAFAKIATAPEEKPKRTRSSE